MSVALVDSPKQFPTLKEMAEWVYDALRERPRGETVTYGELSTVLTIDGQSHRGRAAVLKAGKRLLTDRQRLLVNVKNVGYVIANPKDHAVQSERLRKVARRRLLRSNDAVTYVDAASLSAEDLRTLSNQQVRVRLVLALDRRISRRKELPSRDMIALPSGAELVRMLTRTSRTS